MIDEKYNMGRDSKSKVKDIKAQEEDDAHNAITFESEERKLTDEEM